jgi:glutamate synthase (NADPH/NADH) large chain
VGDKADELEELVRRFAEETGSEVAASLLADWPAAVERFTTVMPRDFARVLAVRDEAEAEGLDEKQTDARIMEVLHG